MTIAERLKRWRLDLGLTQDKAASLAGCSLTCFKQCELGRHLPSATLLTGIAIAGYDINYILTGFTVEENRARLNRHAA